MYTQGYMYVCMYVCIQTKQRNEQIRIDRGKGPGFSTDLAAAVHNILLADYLQLRSIAMGMPLENAYLFHGHTGRDFAETYYWKSHQEVMEKAKTLKKEISS